MKDIEFVYFDVGGVLLLDYSGTNKWIEMKRDLGVTKDLDERFDNFWRKYISRICIDCDVDTLIPILEQEVGVTIPNDYSMLADFVNRFEVNKSIWPVVHEAKKKYKLGLLTNMYPRMFSAILSKKLIPDISWDAIIDSSVVAHQKPELDIYEIAEKKANVDPDKIFFIDNSPKHLEVAKNKGWKTLLYDPQNAKQSNQKIIDALSLEK